MTAFIRFTKDHEWLRVDGEIGTVGITDYAQEQLGDIVFVEVPEIGKTFAQGDEAATVESVKAASEVYAPAGGEVTAANETLADSPALVNESPEAEGWFFQLRLTDSGDLNNLMDEAAYKAYCRELDA